MSNLIKIVLLVKIALIAIIGANRAGILQFGQRPGSAQENNDQKTEQNQIDEKNMSAQQIANHELMKDLLNLPDIDTESVTKASAQKYLNLLESNRKKIESRIAMLAEKIKTYESLEKSLDQKIETISEEAQFFQQTLQKEKEVKKERLNKLITFYEKMEPKKAAPVLAAMDQDLVVALFKAIKQSQVTTILENMDPEKAKDLTEYYGRIRSTNEYELLKEMNQSLRTAFDQCKKS